MIENPRDLHFSEAVGYAGLAARHGYTQQQIADRVGKSRVSVNESLSLLEIPEELREECRRADITARSVLLQIARLKSPAAMREAIAEAAAGSTRDDLRRKKGESAGKRPGRFSFVYKPRGGPSS
jgi:ParB family chromosome partitioning protein